MDVKPGIVFISLMKDSSGGVLEQEVDARHAFALDRLEAFDRQTADLLDRVRRARPAGIRNSRLVEQVLVFVVVEILATAGSRRAWTPADPRCPARSTRISWPTIARSTITLRSYWAACADGRLELLAVLRLRNADRRAEIRGLHEHRIAEACLADSAGVELRAVVERPRSRRPAIPRSRHRAASSPPCPSRQTSARTPGPTYGRSASSSNPWIVPSSPKVPCSTGNTTSMPGLPPGSGRIGRGCHLPSFEMKIPHDFVALRIERCHDRLGGAERDLVLAAAAAVEYRHFQFLHRILFPSADKHQLDSQIRGSVGDIEHGIHFHHFHSDACCRESHRISIARCASR